MAERGKPRKCPDKEVLAELVQRHTTAEIAEMFDVSPSQVYVWKHKYGLSQHYSQATKEELEELLKEHTVKEISVIKNRPVPTIYRWIATYNLNTK